MVSVTGTHSVCVEADWRDWAEWRQVWKELFAPRTVAITPASL